ncbi:hypothetical protein [Defluviimonas sp. WL0075]|uniref:Uncharacterized protein n=1 Tax=Albidovulum sediminicola TaxID=2984331 RepID=A0ABT2YZ23_9RHOB|nr:hypothetical protein [Defluviimonas sp. WL0075]MCV2864109.1 hypothetical protein [Defluviimonas sp. WL0075]
MFAVTSSTLKAGLWEGAIETDSDAEPALEVCLGARVLGGLSLEPTGRGRWMARLPIPADCISDGVQTFVIRARGDGLPVAQFTIIAGQPADEDLRAELALLRAELDMLKQTVRRHLAAQRA